MSEILTETSNPRRSESYLKIKRLFVWCLVGTTLLTIVGLFWALKTGQEELDLANSAETDRDVRHMYQTIRPFLSSLIVFLVVIEWLVLLIGFVGLFKEHYVLSLVFLILQSIGLICSLFQIGPVLLHLKIVWILFDLVITSMAATHLYCLRAELFRPRFNQK